MIRVEINRAKWGKHALLNANNGKMCCLGFICKLAGYSDEMIRGKHFPANVWNTPENQLSGEVPEILQPLMRPASSGVYPYENKALASQLAILNDDLSLTSTEREVELTRVAAHGGYEFVFIGEAWNE